MIITILMLITLTTTSCAPSSVTQPVDPVPPVTQPVEPVEPEIVPVVLDTINNLTYEHGHEVTIQLTANIAGWSIKSISPDDTWLQPTPNTNKLQGRALEGRRDYTVTIVHNNGTESTKTFNMFIRPPVCLIPVIIDTDLGENSNAYDPDDIQSFIHYFLSEEGNFETLAIIGTTVRNASSAGTNVNHINKYLDLLGRADMKSKVRQGALVDADPRNSQPTAGSIYMAEVIENYTPKFGCDYKIQLLTWGGITTTAKMLHDNPELRKKIDIFSIGNWNFLISSTSYNYMMGTFIPQNRDISWIISNISFEGVYYGGNQDGKYNNVGFLSQVIRTSIKHPELAANFPVARHPVNSLKGGDDPSWLRLLSYKMGLSDINNPEDPNSWAGYFTKPNAAVYPNLYWDIGFDVFREHTYMRDRVSVHRYTPDPNTMGFIEYFESLW